MPAAFLDRCLLLYHETGSASGATPTHLHHTLVYYASPFDLPSLQSLPHSGPAFRENRFGVFGNRKKRDERPWRFLFRLLFGSHFLEQFFYKCLDGNRWPFIRIRFLRTGNLAFPWWRAGRLPRAADPQIYCFIRIIIRRPCRYFEQDPLLAILLYETKGVTVHSD